ncbi:hypothetical protein Ocin01_08118 [Orchesella cincta]|uniref:Uncharacterized protein n=1 Tax=Orchesella cincta TaxID=48709 RepID=A0A1D2N030_ORCCI|nr:hypothetical protein Ocin01_08118 [Orchesella cincta]
MPFSEKSGLKDERRPLLRDPVWYSHRYGGRGYETEQQDELLGLDNPRSQKFHWFVFLGVTFVSIVLLLATLGVLLKLSETHPPLGPPKFTTTTLRPAPHTVPNNTATTTTTSTTTTTTSAPTSPSSSVAPSQPSEMPSPPTPVSSSVSPPPAPS